MCSAHQTGASERKFRSTTTDTQRPMIVCRSTLPTLPCGLTSSANRQRPLRSMWGRIDGYGCAPSSIGASSRFSRITGSARQNGRSQGKGSTKFSRCSPDSVPLRVLTRSGKTATASLYSQSGAKRRLCRWTCGRCGQSGPS